MDRKRRLARITERGVDLYIAVGRDENLGEVIGLRRRLERRTQRAFAAILTTRDKDRTLRNRRDG